MESKDLIKGEFQVVHLKAYLQRELWFSRKKLTQLKKVEILC